MLQAQRVYRMLGNEDLWQTVIRSSELLSRAGVPHAIVGGVAVLLHGYQRNTVDVDLLIRPEDSSIVMESLLKGGFTWDEAAKEFRTPSGIVVQMLMAGQKAGAGAEVLLPDPATEATVQIIEQVPVLRLSKLIETKLACGEGNPRRTHRDFADVVELIAVHQLDASFSRFLHRSVQKTFRQLVKRVSRK